MDIIELVETWETGEKILNVKLKNWEWKSIQKKVYIEAMKIHKKRRAIGGLVLAMTKRKK